MNVDEKMADLDTKFDEITSSVGDLWPKYQRGLRESFYRGIAVGVALMIVVRLIEWWAS